MTIGRDSSAAAAFRRKDKHERRGMISDAQCDHSCLLGYLRIMEASCFQSLARIRSRPARNRSEKLKRKADFLTVLSKIVERHGRIAELQEQDRNHDA